MKIVLQNLTKTFPARNQKANGAVVAVNNFTFTIPDGKLICLLGPAECGSSTALHLIGGLQKPSSGRIFFENDDVTNVSYEARDVGLVLQNHTSNPQLTVKQNILLPLKTLKGKDKLKKADMQARALYVAKLVQIDNMLERKLGELSSAQQHRVAIACALAKLPSILLIDELPLNLDTNARLQIYADIRRIQKETGITAIFTTHNPEEAMRISDQIVVMNRGVVQQIAQPQELHEDPETLFVANFLDAHPINIFEGEVKDELLYIGGVAVMNAPGVGDHPVSVGIRPEGFVPDSEGPMVCERKSIEVSEEDVIVVSTHPDCINEDAILHLIEEDDNASDALDTTVSYSLKQDKVFLFNQQNGKRIRPFLLDNIFTAIFLEQKNNAD